MILETSEYSSLKMQYTLIPLHLLVTIYIGSAHILYFVNIKFAVNKIVITSTLLTFGLHESYPWKYPNQSLIFSSLVSTNNPVNLTSYIVIYIYYM